MTNRELLEAMDNRALAEWLSDLSERKIPLKDFCIGFCSYADKNGRCTKLDAAGDIDCELSISDMIYHWLKAENSN
ncbi:MAG: hypothetical protein UC361_05190 [Bulleidia sp.]|nr:hypothetical protein [Bulleidia sp.]